MWQLEIMKWCWHDHDGWYLPSKIWLICNCNNPGVWVWEYQIYSPVHCLRHILQPEVSDDIKKIISTAQRALEHNIEIEEIRFRHRESGNIIPFELV